MVSANSVGRHHLTTTENYRIASNWQSNVLYGNKGNGTFQDVTATVGLDFAGNQGTSNGTFYLNNSAGLWLRGSIGTTESFMRIGHSLLALIAAFVGGQLAHRLHGNRREPVQEPARPRGSTSAVGSEDRVHG